MPRRHIDGMQEERKMSAYAHADRAIAAYRAKMARRRFFWQSFKTLAIIAGAFELATIVAVFAMH